MVNNPIWTHPPVPPTAAPAAEAEAVFADKFADFPQSTWPERVHAAGFPQVADKPFPVDGSDAEQSAYFRTELIGGDSTQMAAAQGMRKSVYGENLAYVTTLAATVGDERKLVVWLLARASGDVAEFFADIKPLFLGDSTPSTPLTLFVLNAFFTMGLAQQVDLSTASRAWYLGGFKTENQETYLKAFQRLFTLTTPKWFSLPRGRASRVAAAAASAAATPAPGSTNTPAPVNPANAGDAAGAGAPPGVTAPTPGSGDTPPLPATGAVSSASGSASNPITLADGTPISATELEEFRAARAKAKAAKSGASHALPNQRAALRSSDIAASQSATLLHFSPNNNAAQRPGAETVLATIHAFLGELKNISYLVETVAAIAKVTMAHDPLHDFAKGAPTSIVEFAAMEIRAFGGPDKATTGDVITAYKHALEASRPDNDTEKDLFNKLALQFARAASLADSNSEARKIDRALSKRSRSRRRSGYDSSDDDRSRSRSRSPPRRRRRARSRERSPKYPRRRDRSRSRSRSPRSRIERERRPPAAPAVLALRSQVATKAKCNDMRLVCAAVARILDGNCPQCRKPMERPYHRCSSCNRSKLNSYFVERVKDCKSGSIADIK